MVKTIAILGAGTMGQGIAQVAALADFDVIVYDLEEGILTSALEKIFSTLKKGVDLGKISAEQALKAKTNISTSTDLPSLKADLFIEAVIENIEVKQKLFKTIEKSNPNAILASNTSSIPITQVAASLENPSQLAGMHFFNPAHIMKLVEIVKGARTKPEIEKQLVDVAKKMGKVPVLAADSPGFIVNRVARQFYVESLKILEENVSNIEDIDTLLRATGFKMGPFQLMDLIGVDTNFSVTKTMYNQFHQDEKFRPSRVQQQYVDAGYVGKKSGRGFYTYDR